MSPTLGVSVALWVWATSGLAGVNVGAGLEFLFLVLPGLVPVVVTVSGVVKVPGVSGCGDQGVCGVSGDGDRRTFGVSGLEDTYVAGAVYIVAVGCSSLNVFVKHL